MKRGFDAEKNFGKKRVDVKNGFNFYLKAKNSKWRFQENINGCGML